MRKRRIAVMLFVLCMMAMATACSENTESSQKVEPVILEDEGDTSGSDESATAESGTAAVDYTTSTEEITLRTLGKPLKNLYLP